MSERSDRSRPGLHLHGVRTLALALALVAAACGGDVDSATGEPATADTADTANDATSTTATPTTTPAAEDGEAHERMVVLAEESVLADVLTLGFVPIASTVSVADVGFQGLNEYDTTGIEVLPMTTLNLEELAALEPDTIVTFQFWVDQIGEDLLGGMGELVVIPDGLTILERLTTLGQLLGRESEAAAIVADLDEATQQAAEAVPNDCRVSLAAIYPGPSPAAFVAGPWDLPTAILSTGCALDPDASEATPDQNGRVYLSLEQLDMLDAPTLVLLQSDTVEGEQDALDQISAEPLWSLLPAVQDDNVVVFDRLGYPGATGQIRFLDEFAELFQ